MTMNRSNERAHPCLVPNLQGGGISTFSPLSKMLAVGFGLYIYLNQVEEVAFYF